MSAKKKQLLKSLIKLLAITIIGLSVLPYFIYHIWWIDIFSNFQVQYLALLISLVILFILKKKWKWVFFLGIGIVFSCSQIFPLYVNTSAEAKVENVKPISMMSINLLSTNRNATAVINYIENQNPDILVLSEFNSYWDKQLVEVLETYSYTHKVLREDNFGIGVWSKLPASMQTLYFNELELPSILLQTEGVKKSFSVITTHPFPPVGQCQFEVRNKHLTHLAAFISRENYGNVAVIGDLNTSSFSKNFQLFKEKASLKDSREGFGILPSWPASVFLLQTTLDHALVSEDVSVLRREVGEHIGSDHLPIYLEISLP